MCTETKPYMFSACKISANIISHYTKYHNMTHHHLHSNALCLIDMSSFNIEK